MKRLTRLEQQQRTRERLLAAARKLYLAHGIDGVSLDKVAAAAGYSKGAVYANFESKEHLLIALWEIYYGGKRTAFANALANHEDVENLLKAIEAVMEDVFALGPWPLLAAELARRSDHPELKKALHKIEQSEQKELDGLLQELIKRTDAMSSANSRALLADLMAFSEGLLLRAPRDDLSPREMARRFMSFLKTALGV